MSKLGYQLSDAAFIIKRPRVTEKATFLSNQKTGAAYTFEVAAGATKPQIKAAVKSLYNVLPLKVNMSNSPAKQVVRRGKSGRRAGLRKAVVYLKPGEKIEFV